MPDAPHLDRSLAVLADPGIEAFGMLIETHNELMNAVGKRLDEEMLVPVPWLGVLIRLARSPDERLRMTRLARDMTMSTSGLTRLIDRVEVAGHVRRESCPEDRRGLLAVLTPEGRGIVATAAPMHVADLERLLAAPLTDGELAQLTDLLRRVRDHVRSLDTPG
ncbi:MAG: MarR family winged helix-turn-helix transcriptional regulator [Acidimicrobiales bacterium]